MRQNRNTPGHRGPRFAFAWNEYFGRVEAQGKTLSEMTAFRDSQDKVCGVVVIPKRNQDTFGRDIEDMITRKWTFDEAIVAEEFHLVSKQRLTMVRRELFEQLDKISF
jgi:hypothetical protein